MRPQIKLLLSSTLILFVTFQAFSQNTIDAPPALLKTWYAVKIGKTEGGEMKPTKRNSILIISGDGSLKIKEEDTEIDARWDYLEDLADLPKIQITMEMQGSKRVVELPIKELKENKLLLIDRSVVTEYSSSPPDPNAPKPREAPLVVNSVSTIDVSSWTGLHPFNYKIIESKDGQIERKEAIGVLILLNVEGKNILRLNEDGLTTDIEVAKGIESNDEMHFDLITKDPKFAGKVIFRKDNSLYFKHDNDLTKVEYIKQ